MYELSRFHGMAVLLHAEVKEPIISVQSAAGEWRADVRLSDFEVISGDLDSVDAMSIKEWWLLRRDGIAVAWDQITAGMAPDPIEPLPEDWPIGGPEPIRAISVKPREGHRALGAVGKRSCRRIGSGFSGRPSRLRPVARPKTVRVGAYRRVLPHLGRRHGDFVPG